MTNVKKFFNNNKSLKTLPVKISAILLIAIIPLLAAKKEESKYYPLTIFSRVLSHIQDVYVDQVDISTLIYGAIRGMVSSLDPHSSYLSPEEFRTLQEEIEGKFGGVGMEVEYRFGRLIVISPLPGSPAEKAGIIPGDEILFIDDSPAMLINFEKAIRMMRGKPGTKVKIKLRRGEDKVLEVEITREIIKVESVEMKVLSDDSRIALLIIKVFQEGTLQKARSYLDKIATSWQGNIGGLIIDLRNNPGGLLDEATGLADEFIDKGILMTTRKANGEIIESEKAHKIGTRSGFPIVIVVNEFTASAAEVFAGAMQDNKKATIIGSKTFGKGSIQSIIKLPDGSALKLTTALYATPSGKIIQAEGIEPDLIVPQVKWDIQQTGYTFSEKNLEGYLKIKSEESKTVNPRLMEIVRNDYQLFMAYQVLNSKIKEWKSLK